mgnify:CR=1 FL=1
MKQQRRVVIDASAVLAMMLPDERQRIALPLESLIADDTIFAAPDLLRYEVMNALMFAQRSARIQTKHLYEIWSLLHEMNIQYSAVSNWEELYSTAQEHDLTVYDAAYLQLAVTQEAQLLTEDRELFQVAQNLEIALCS